MARNMQPDDRFDANSADKRSFCFEISTFKIWEGHGTTQNFNHMKAPQPDDMKTPTLHRNHPQTNTNKTKGKRIREAQHGQTVQILA